MSGLRRNMHYDAANGYFQLTTSAVINDSVETLRIIALPLAVNTFDRNRHFRVAIMLTNNTTNKVASLFVYLGLMGLFSDGAHM